MATICKVCGAELPDGTSFCTNCGTKVVADEQPLNNGQSAYDIPSYEQQPQYEQPRYEQNAYQAAPVYQQPAPAAEDQGLEKPASFWAFLGLEIIQGIPLIGIIAQIICCFAPKNKSIKHYSAAKIILRIVGFLLIVILAAVYGAIIANVLAESGLSFGEIFNGIQNGNIQ